MQSFKLSPESFERAKWKMITPGLIVIAIIFWAILKEGILTSIEDLENKESIITLVICTVIPVVITFITMKIYMTKQRRKWLSYELIVDEDKIIRKQEGNSTIEISRKEITNIRESVGYGITISTDSRRKMIFIPESAEQYDKIKILLNSWSIIKAYHPRIKGNTLSVFLANREADREQYLRTSRNLILSRLLIIIIPFILLFILVFILENLW